MIVSIRAALTFLVCVAALPAQSSDKVLAEAKTAADAKQTDAAAKAFGRAAAIAQKANDLLAEQRVAKELRPFLEPLKDAELADALAAIAAGLDPKRAGAFVSARALATELLELATVDGKSAHVAEAAKILAAQSTLPKCGKEARVLASYAKGMELAAQGKAKEAVPVLEGALKTAVEEEWADLAVYLGTETAAQAVAAGDSAKAASELAMVASLFTNKNDADLIQTWERIGSSRLKDAPPEALQPFKDATKGTRSASAAGGAGGSGGAGGPTKLANAWEKLGSSQSVVSAKRQDDAYEISAAFDPALKAKHPLKPGFTHWSQEGIGLGMRSRGVALILIDLKAAPGHQGDSSSTPPGIPFYRLAKGETWLVSKQGVVTITGA